MGRDNAADLIRGIERGDNGSGQMAFELASMLRSPDHKYDALRNDSALARRLADFLARDLDEPLRGTDQPRVMRRMFLCRVIGEFHVSAGLDVLLRAVKEEHDVQDVEVRLSALEAIASLASHCGQESLHTDDIYSAVIDASRSRDEGENSGTAYQPHAELRAVAAYCLGVLGGEQAIERMKQMLNDPYPNTRYNAATGLARYGEPQCARVLREMLDAKNDLALRDEANPNDQARKRTTVLLNGIRATVQFAKANPAADVTPLKTALHELETSSLEDVKIDRSKIKSAATEALRRMDE